MHLYQALAQRLDAWGNSGYPHPEYAAIGEILEWAARPEGPGFRLRPPQVRALETYWHLRLVAGTPHVIDLYRALFPKKARLMALMEHQAGARADAAAQPPALPFPQDEEAVVESAAPAQLSFAVYRVNDYDLQIQHNEAVNLACDYMGIVRTRSDAFFDGTLGKRLVKIIPFGHPLTLLDLEEVKRELGARPDEERDVVLVCLGKELAVDGWLEEWNRMRSKGDVPNKLEAVELRTDPKFGGFFAHQPADARVTVERSEGKLTVRIDNFVSPSIVERLKSQAGVLAPAIDDWRAMVDSVMIDPAYDGQVFKVVLADVPEKKTDLVAGEYTLDAPEGPTTVAVKVTDMLGEEVLKTAVV